MKITKLKLENFRGIRNMELDFHPRLNVLVGINGAGKTSVLDALASSLSWWTACWCKRKSPSKWQGEPLKITDITNGENDAACSIQLKLGEDHPEETPWWTLRVGNNGETNKDYDLQISEDFSSLRQTVTKLLDQENLYFSPPVIYYPINRTEEYFRNSSPIPNTTLNEILSERVPALETLRQLFSPSFYHREINMVSIQIERDYKSFLDWMNELQREENIKLRELQELGQDTSDPLSYQSPKLMGVKKTWNKLFSGSLSNFIVKSRYFEENIYLSCRKNGVEISDTQLSGGEKAVLALAGSMTQRFIDAKHDSPDFFEEPGIVLIDEIELHLHPQWQRTILSKLMEIFPNTQFIVTTHSPQVLGELKSENIILLESTSEGIVSKRIDDEVFGLTSNDILEGVMDTDDRTSSIASKLSDFYDAVARNEFDQAHEILDELRTTTDIPELEKLEMRLRRMSLVQ